MHRRQRYLTCIGLMLMLSFLSVGCTSNGSASGTSAGRSNTETAVLRSSAKSASSSVKVESNGEYGFTLSEVVRIDADVRRDYQRAVLSLQADQFAAGIELLESIVERAPDVTNPHIDLGIAYSRVGRFAEAEASLAAALVLAPNHPAALNELGILQRRAGRFEEARGSYEQALIIHPGFHFALLNLGMLCDLYLQDLSCALENYTRYEAIVPDDPDIRIWIADVQGRMAVGG